MDCSATKPMRPAGEVRSNAVSVLLQERAPGELSRERASCFLHGAGGFATGTQARSSLERQGLRGGGLPGSQFLCSVARQINLRVIFVQWQRRLRLSQNKACQCHSGVCSAQTQAYDKAPRAGWASLPAGASASAGLSICCRVPNMSQVHEKNEISQSKWKPKYAGVAML